MTAAPTSTPTTPTPTPSPRTDVVVATRYRFLELSEKVENENIVNHMHACLSARACGCINARSGSVCTGSIGRTQQCSYWLGYYLSIFLFAANGTEFEMRHADGSFDTHSTLQARKNGIWSSSWKRRYETARVFSSESSAAA